MVGHLINGKGKKVAGPTISGSFDGILTAHMEDGCERKLWEKNWGPHGRDGRCVGRISQLGCTSTDSPVQLLGEHLSSSQPGRNRQAAPFQHSLFLARAHLPGTCSLLQQPLADADGALMCNSVVSSCRFNYSYWTASLNEIAQGQRGRLPATDTRFRPDVRAIEEGRFVEVLLLFLLLPWQHRALV